MKTFTFDTTLLVIAAASFFLCLAASSGSTAGPPRPTPSPGSLGAYAKTVTLNRSILGNGDGRVVLSNDSVTALALNGSITLGTVTQADRKKPESVADNAERARWQAAHGRQREVIAGLERRRARLEFEIKQIENLGLTAKTMARLEQTQGELRLLDDEIAAERAELARIVRDARRRGAEPGWFR